MTTISGYLTLGELTMTQGLANAFATFKKLSRKSVLKFLKRPFGDVGVTLEVMNKPDLACGDITLTLQMHCVGKKHYV